jgi:hypothetical protein
MPTPYVPAVDLTKLNYGATWPASLAEAKKLPPEKLASTVSAALKNPPVKAYLAECQKVADIMTKKIWYDTAIDEAAAEIAIIVAYFTSLQGDSGIGAKLTQAKSEACAALEKLQSVIKKNWDTVKPYIYKRNGTTLDCAMIWTLVDGVYERADWDPPPLYTTNKTTGEVTYHPENEQYYSILPKVIEGSADWPQFFQWMTEVSPLTARTNAKALYVANGELNNGTGQTKALYPAVAKFLKTEVEPKLIALLVAWRYGSDAVKAQKKNDKKVYEGQIEAWSAERKVLADNYAAQLKQLPLALQNVPAGFLREVAYEYGGALIAAQAAKDHANAAEELADRAGKKLQDSGKAVNDARGSQSRVVVSGGVDFGEAEGSTSAAGRAGAAFAGAHAASRRAGATTRNGKAKTENDAARTLNGVAEEKTRNLNVPPPPASSGIKERTDETDGKINDNAKKVISQGDELLDIFSKLPELDLSNLSAQVDHNSNVADTQLQKPRLPWWIFALAGLAYLRR